MVFSLALIYDDSGKRYILPIEVLERHLDEQTLDELKRDALKEVSKL